MKIHRGIGAKIGGYFLVTNLILVLVLGGLLYFNSSNLIIQKEIVTLKENVESNANYIEIYVDKLTTLSTIISKNQDVVEYLEGKNQEEDKILKMMDTILKTDNYLKSVILIRRDGKVISSGAKLDMTFSKNMMKEKWYVDAIERHMPVLNPLRRQNYSKENMNDWVISISRDIRDEKGWNLGVLLIDIKYQALHEYLKSKENDENSDTIILDENNNVVYYKNIPCSVENKVCFNKYLNLEEGYDYKDNIVVVKSPIKNTNWFLIETSSLNEIIKLKRHFFELILVSSLISLLITIIISLFVLKRITRPIKTLEKHMNSLSDRLEKISISGDVSTEIESLQNHFNEMIDKIKYLREYEIKALYSQINPHFLYNTLETIIWMAEFKDNEKVISITQALANFFRISLSQGKEKIPLKDEINHIKEYLYIQKQRYEDKLNYTIEVDSELEDIEVPKIILQPIVENAIYHGIKNINGNGEIKIYTQNFENYFKIVIEDNGIGFANTKKQENIKIGGIGLKNVDKRLKFYYGEKYGIKIDNYFEKGARVEILIPKDK